MNKEKIDLHGLRHEDVPRILIAKIESMWDSDQDLEIITGYSSRMKEIVLKIVKEYKLEVREGNFDGSNMGFFTVMVP